jgi:2,4-dienoyl-CoA reductase-like NADH-dependent reductase (Old Yellow Enzyme family)
MTSTDRQIFRPLTVRGVTLRNRIVMSPMTRMASPGGVPSEPMAAYYRRRAEHGVGLIVTEGIGIDHPTALGAGSMGEADMPELHGEAALARWHEIVAGVHQAGGVIFPQLWHQGPVRTDRTGPHPERMSSRPSGLWGPRKGLSTVPPAYLEEMLVPTAPMTDEDVVDVIAGFARSAANARAAGFDGIAVHGAHGYLPDAFFWHETNKRTDRWGGATLRERAAFGAELVKAIRAEAGDMPIMFRFSQWKLQDYNGHLARTPEELEGLLGPLADAGVDIFDASTRQYHQAAFEGSPLTLAGWTRKLTGTTTMAVGGIGLSKELKDSFAGDVEPLNNVPDVEQRIEAGEFDLAGVGRSLVADPAWAEKVRSDEPFLPFHPRMLAEVL